MSDLVLLKTFARQSEAEPWQNFLAAGGVAGVVVLDQTARSKDENDRAAEGGVFDLMVPAVAVTRAQRLVAAKDAGAEIERLRAEIAETTDKYKRAVATIENLRRQYARERREISQSALENFLNDAAPVLDTLEKALPSDDSARPAAATPNQSDAVYNGLLLAKQKLTSLFKKYGVPGAPARPEKEPSHELELPAPEPETSPTLH